MASELDDRKIFGIIQPYCVNLSRIALLPPDLFDPNSIESINTLKDVYTHLYSSLTPETIISTNLADYIFVPLSYLLKQPKLGDSQTTYLLQILTLLIRHSWSQKFSLPYSLSKQLFPLISFLTGGPPNPKPSSEIDSKSIPLKLAGSKALNELFESLYAQKENKLYDFFSNVENLPALGHSITILLEFAFDEKSIDLQIQSLNTLNTLYFKLINDAEILSYILPGNVSTLTKIIASTTANFMVISSSIELLKKLLVLVYDDEALLIDFKELETFEQLNEAGFQMDQILLKETSFQKVHRTASWLKATSSQVKLSLENVKKAQFHSKFEVREKLYQFSKRITERCIFSLNSSIPILIEIMAYLSNDSRLEININGELPMNDIKYKAAFEKSLLNEFDTRVESFTSVIQSPNETKILSTINALAFLIRNSSNDFLASKLIDSAFIELNDLLNKTSRKPKFITSTTDISMLMAVSRDISSVKLSAKSITVFDRVLTKDIQIELSKLFQTLGEYNPDVSDLIDNLLAREVKTVNEKSTILWIANNLAQGYINKAKPKVVVAEFLQFDDDDDGLTDEIPEFLFSLLDHSKDILDGVSDETLNEPNEQLISIALDSFGIIANFMRKDFKSELVDYLYPIIDALASPSDSVRNHALNSCYIIADNIYSGSLYNLILDNADYLVDAISIRLSGALTTRTTAILAVCVRIAGFKIIESFKDVLEIIFSLLDFYHGYADICLNFFVLFEIVIDEIKKKYLNGQNLAEIEHPSNISSFQPWGMTNVQQLIALLDKSQKDILIEPEENPMDSKIENIEDEGDSDDDDEIDYENKRENTDEIVQQEQKEPEEEKWVSPVPKEAYRLLQQIVFYGERLLTHPSAQLQVQILKTYAKALPIFATQPQNLYPIAASIWPIVSYNLCVPDPKVVIPASKVASQLIEFTNLFLSKRFIDLWSKLKVNQLLVSTKSLLASSSTKQVSLPGLNMKCFESLVDMLMIALERLGRTIPDIIVEEIISCCIEVIPDIERFGIHQDTAWIMKNEKFVKQRDVPENLVFNGKLYTFIDIHEK